jgi:hypothetical protein
MNAEGSLQLADAELLYHESGEFEMTSAANQSKIPKFSFLRKYIWRLQKAEDGHVISVWFTKPGTETIDYLFHKIDVPAKADPQSDELVLQGNGGHLCVQDFYSSSYSFRMKPGNGNDPELASFTTAHEVRGPKKDQFIETVFTRP